VQISEWLSPQTNRIFLRRVSLTFENLKLHGISAPRAADWTWSVDGTGRNGVGFGVGIKRALLHILALGSQRLAGAQGHSRLRMIDGLCFI
jgi:hypothetical protein